MRLTRLSARGSQGPNKTFGSTIDTGYASSKDNGAEDVKVVDYH